MIYTLTIKLPSREFYARDTATVAKDLLGMKIVRKIGSAVVSCTITETEAYKHMKDPASHAYSGMTKRNSAMFGEVGRAYVYFTYGMHHCFNVVARSPRVKAGAVLIRAARPDLGIKIMEENRKNAKISELVNGPAKLTQAMCIDANQYGVDLCRTGSLFIAEGIRHRAKILSSTRIGISKAAEKRWNYRISV